MFADEHSLSFFEVKEKMSSVGVVTQKKSKCFVRRKSKCPKKNFQSVEREKNVSVEFRTFRKKK